ncbi:bestrophin-2-like [Saccoglossus kowalevskii]|uniref:Bestrophin homolog n=1 Tax=Saccoglossus kowalevskii TaxID=10224 RepID=A0ABM0N053_SACKO|nr:PREDICTED: bestrophin-3-like [Saccoglossus kowalevskii]
MTVTYSLKVSRTGTFTFPRLLFMWKGSVYKLLYKELLIYLLLFYALSLTYRFALTGAYKAAFELTCSFFKDSLLDAIPLSFLMGFYVSLVVSRWWDKYVCIPNTDEICQVFATFIRGSDDVTRMQRRTLVRWITLSSAIVYTSVSAPVFRRFPTTKHLVQAGLLTEKEHAMFENMPTPHVKWWLPLSWSCNLVARLKAEGKIESGGTAVIQKIQLHRASCATMMDYDWIGVPLVYTQVVTIATYTFFIAKLFSSQFLESSTDLDIWFPVILVFEFLFYFGWLKVAEVMINPYGGDDDDFEINYILDRMFQVGLLIVDNCYDLVPDLEKDRYWELPFFSLPSSKSVESLNQGKAWLGSTIPAGFQTLSKEVMSWSGVTTNGANDKSNNASHDTRI